MADVGRILGGRYQLVELVGQGGMATIYRARDHELGREVAVKVLRAEYGSDAAFVLRFRREAQAAAQLAHPNVVSVYDTGSDEVGPYIVMELVTGGDLAAVLRERGPLPASAAARIGQQIADALEAAHARGIVHRDIKPSNVLLTSGGRVKVADFGIAQAFTEVQLTLTQPGMTMGSVHYFSPEQARGEVVTGASDVYSAGLVLFEMLTGMRAFGGDSAAAVAMARLTGQVPAPAYVRPDVPPALDAIVRWTLAPDARARPSATELSMALGRFLADPHGTVTWGVAPPAPPVVPTSRYPAPEAPDPAGRFRWLGALAGVFVLVLAGVLIFLIIAWSSGTPARSPDPTTGRSAAPSLVPAATPLLMPPFEGLQLTDARELATRFGVLIRVTERETADAEPGTVMGQDPPVGTIVMPGDTVELTVAVAPATVAVPDLRLLTEADAIAVLLDAGLTPGARFDVWSNQVPEGRVVRSDPRAGAAVAAGTPIDYAISRGPRPTPVPASLLPTPTLTPGVVTTPTPTPTPRSIRTPRPTRAPTPIPPDPTPAPTPLSTPVARVVVGNYQCQDLATTRQLIEESGLRVGDVLADAPEFDEDWLVVGQVPEAGREVALGRRIALFVVDPSSPCP